MESEMATRKEAAAQAGRPARTARIERETKETRIRVQVDLDGSGSSSVATGIGFFDHMLEQIARHGAIDLQIEASGDLHIDGHHTVEDVGIALGRAVAAAAGDKQGIRRFGHAYVPLDEALTRVVADFSGRPGLHWHVDFARSTWTAAALARWRPASASSTTCSSRSRAMGRST